MTRVDIGVFAHNEASGIAAMLQGLAAQDFTGLKARILLLANGCRDQTVTIARALDLPGVDLVICDLPEGGKSRSWNRFVHDLSDPQAEVLIFADADIDLPAPDSLRRMVAGLQRDPALYVFNSQPVKDITYRPDGLSRLDRIIAMAGGGLDDWRTAICGQLYAMPAARARAFHLPIGLPVEDGFLRAMVLTDALTAPEDMSRISGGNVFHIYASERKMAALIRHQVRIVIGSAVNAALFAALRLRPAIERRDILAQAAADPDWISTQLSAQLPRWPYAYVPLHFLTKRTTRILGNWRGLRRPKQIFLLFAGFGFDLSVYILAQIRMARGGGAGYW